jgi:hypothetical protein
VSSLWELIQLRSETGKKSNVNTLCCSLTFVVDINFRFNDSAVLTFSCLIILDNNLSDFRC